MASTRQSKEDFQLLVGHGKWQRNCGGMLLIDARFQWMNQNKLAKLPNLPQRESFQWYISESELRISNFNLLFSQKVEIS